MRNMGHTITKPPAPRKTKTPNQNERQNMNTNTNPNDRDLVRALREKIAKSGGRIKHILIGWRALGAEPTIRLRDYTSDAEFDADTRDLYAKGASVIYAVHA